MIDTQPAPTGTRVPAARAVGLPPHARTVITVLLVAAFVAILNETIISVAIPVLMQDLGIDASTGQWLSTAFMLTLAVVIPVTGFLIQRMPTRTLFLLAMTLFSVGTLLAGLAPGFVVLLIARIIQGSGTALMFPLLMTTVMALVPEEGRGRMMGNISLVISVAPALGPVVGGVVLNFLSWRWMFFVVLPIAIVSLLIGVRYMTNVGETKRVPVDLVSVPLAALGFGGLVYALNAIGSGGGAAQIWGPATVGAVAMALFLWRQLALQRTDRALLDLRPFRSRVFSASVIAASVAMVALLGAAILLPIYLQNVLGTTPLVSGLLVLPGGVVMGILGPIVGGLYDRVGPRVLLLPGATVVAVALGLLAMAGTATPIWFVLVAHVVLSIGLAFVLTPLFTAGLGAVPPRYAAHGSAIFGTVQQVGGAAGTALVVTLLAIGAAGERAAGAAPAAAQASGLHLAFLVAAIVSVAAIVASAFVTRPDSFAPRSTVPPRPPERLDALHFARTRPARYVRDDRVLLHALSGLTSGPTFLLVHGIGVGCRYFARLIPQLEDLGRVRTVELPGFDRSPKPPDVLGVEDHADLLAAYVADRGDGPVVAVGHSMGAQIVTDLAVRHPAAVSAVALLGPVTDDRERTAWQQGLRLGQDTLREPPLANRVVFTDYARTGPRRYFATLPSMLDYDLLSALPRVTVPSLVVRGARDPIARSDWAARVARRLPAGRLVEVPGAAHVVMWSHPEAVARELRRLAAVP